MSMAIRTLDGKHVGTRWAAGQWCWECRRPCDSIYRDKATRTERRYPKGDTPGFALDFLRDNALVRWECPRCGASLDREASEGFNPAMRELGFDTSAPRAHHGIDGASGFHWCTDPSTGLGDNRADIWRAIRRRRALVTEYGDRLTIPAFEAMFADILPQDGYPNPWPGGVPA